MIPRAVFTFLFAAVAPLTAAEPILGSWLLNHQVIAGENTPPARPLMLRIVQTDDYYEFQYALLVGQKQEISLRFSVRLNGAPADVKNFAGVKIGTATVKRDSPLSYLVTLEGPRRPTSSGKMTVSNNGKTLTSESDSAAPDGTRTHTVQVFDRKMSPASK